MPHRITRAVLTVFITSSLSAQTISLEKRVVEHTYANGLKLLVLERHFSPTVSIKMMFRTGSVDESTGKTGLAHMFEHMMFKGTETLGTRNYAREKPLLKKIDDLHRRIDTEKLKGAHARQDLIAGWIEQLRATETEASKLVKENELWNLYDREGGSGLNASTSKDFTRYTVDLPSNKLELWAILDSDRVRHPVFRQFYQEREVVKEERRMRVDTSPDGKLFEEFLAFAYAAHPYRTPTIGWESDLDHLTVGDLEDFYKRFYTPDQLTIAVVGDVKAAEVITLVDRYFGPWKGSASARPAITREPAPSGPRSIEVKFDAQPMLVMGYHIPTFPDPDHATTYAVAQILANGVTSRLYKRLVEKDKIATGIDSNTDYPGERYNTLLILSAAPRHPHQPEDIVKVVDQEIERLAREPVAEWELEKLRAGLDVAILQNFQTNPGLAATLVYNQTIFGDWRYLTKFQEKINALTPKDVQTAVQRYLRADHRTLAILRPTGKKK